MCLSICRTLTMKKSARNKSIAVFAERLYGGGVERILDTILRHIDKQLISITVYASHEEQEYIPIEGLEYKYYFETPLPNDTDLTVLIKKSINKIKLFVYYHFSPRLFFLLFVRKKYDTTLAFIEGYATRIASGAQKDTRKIAWVHADMKDYHWSSIAFQSFSEEKACYESFEKVVCVSQKVKAEMVDLFGIGMRTVVLYNPIDKEEILRKAAAQIEVKRPLKGRIKLLSVGSLIPVKGYNRLIDCIQNLYEDGLDLNLTIVGDGPEKLSLENKIRLLSLEDRVLLTGFESNPYPYFANADIFVCSSYAEGFSTVVTEALIMGLPIVATECSGIREQLGNNQWGLITTNDDEALQAGICQLSSDRELRAQYSSRAKEAGQKYSLHENLKAIESLLSL